MMTWSGVRLPRRPRPAGLTGKARAPEIWPSSGISERTISCCGRVRSAQSASRTTTKAWCGSLLRPAIAKIRAASPLDRSGSRICSTFRVSASVYATVAPCGAVTGMKNTPRSSTGTSSCGSAR